MIFKSAELKVEDYIERHMYERMYRIIVVKERGCKESHRFTVGKRVKLPLIKKGMRVIIRFEVYNRGPVPHLKVISVEKLS